MLESLSFLEDWTDTLVVQGKHLEDQILSSPIGSGVGHLQNATIWMLKATIWPDFDSHVEQFVERYRYEYHNHVDLALKNPFHVVLIVLAYLVLVYGGMAVMKRTQRKFELKAYGVLHNLCLTLLSLFMCVEIFRQAWLLGYSFAGNIGIAQKEEHQMMKILWVFYASKILEMGDTVIMVLKKNFHQISFLHVYHHVTIFLIWWFIIYAYPCGDSYFSASQNSFVHVVMYSYYFMSLLKIPTPWKRAITYIQMTQFVLNVGQALFYLYWLKKEPALPMQILLYYCISLLILFYNYLYQSTRKEKQAKKEKQHMNGHSKKTN